MGATHDYPALGAVGAKTCGLGRSVLVTLSPTRTTGQTTSAADEPNQEGTSTSR
jgi:hypothetical protein